MKSTAIKNLTDKHKLNFKNNISKQLCFAQFPFQSPYFNELNLFRKQIDLSGSFNQLLYTSKKKSVWIYRATFITFAILFAILGITTLSVPSAITIGFFSTSTTLKGLVLALCTTLALASFLIGVTMRTDREAVIHCLENGRRTLHTIYVRKKIQLGLMRFFTIFGPQRRHAKALHHMYQEILAKMDDRKEDALHLITKISENQTFDDDHKELLLNQATAELHDDLIRLAHSLKNADVTID